MCVKCHEAVKKYFPKLKSNKSRVALLIGATCFPFGSAKDVTRQLKELVKETDGTLQGALAYAEAQMDKDMKKARKHEEAVRGSSAMCCGVPSRVR